MKIEVKEIKSAPPPKEYVLTLSRKEFEQIFTAIENIDGHSFGNGIGPDGEKLWPIDNVYSQLKKFY